MAIVTIVMGLGFMVYRFDQIDEGDHWRRDRNGLKEGDNSGIVAD